MREQPMTTFDAVMIAEGAEEATDEERIEAFQFIIDNGIVWQLQGWFGRTAMALIEAGHCTPANR